MLTTSGPEFATLGVGILSSTGDVLTVGTNLSQNYAIVFQDLTSSTCPAFCVAGSAAAYVSDSLQNDVIYRNPISGSGFLIGFSTGASTYQFRSAGFTSEALMTAGDGLQFTNATSGYIAATLNYYETNSYTATFSGIWATNQTTTIDLTRIGNMVTMMIKANILTTANTASTITSVGGSSLPTRFCPAITLQFTISVADNDSFYTDGSLSITSSGIMEIFNTQNSNFSGSGTSGIVVCAVSYLTS